MSSAERILKQWHNSSFSQLTKAKPLSKYISIFLLPLCQHVNKKGKKKRGKRATGLDQLDALQSSLESSESRSSSSSDGGRLPRLAVPLTPLLLPVGVDLAWPFIL
jgi:hypothetical protein